jgi:hypothetical protein
MNLDLGSSIFRLSPRRELNVKKWWRNSSSFTLSTERQAMLTKSKFARRSMLGLTAAAVVFIALPVVPANAASMTHSFTVLAKGKFEGAGKGEAKGSVNARFTANLDKNTLCYSITSHGITGISGVHIHIGAAGVNGGVAVALDPMKIGHKGKTCVAVAAKLLAEISANPSNYYFNAHTPMYPNGAVRGQLANMAG